ncbi:unnamed protein product [Pieris brassicae]|uniref:Uncharacterized protein n=1 Tax=Pieris brassicae TaxID=7116 RepID=A0A9P0T4X8_PIEBR|nr:unnamed protein product [Pieris brassicae]
MGVKLDDFRAKIVVKEGMYVRPARAAGCEALSAVSRALPAEATPLCRRVQRQCTRTLANRAVRLCV